VCDVLAGLGFDRLRLFIFLAWARAEHELNRCTPLQKIKNPILSVCLSGSLAFVVILLPSAKWISSVSCLSLS
jgi:hypothetical protein